MSLSQNGWPALSADDPRLHLWRVPGTDRHFRMRNGSAGFLLAHFILWYHEEVQRLNKKGDPWDEWAYAYRDVRGSDEVSNHSSGTAVDLNSTRYPLGTTWMRRWRKVKIRARLLFYRRCLRWGGDYRGRKDEMHFEVNRNMEACERNAKRLMKTPRGQRILNANPSQRAVILS